MICNAGHTLEPTQPNICFSCGARHIPAAIGRSGRGQQSDDWLSRTRRLQAKPGTRLEDRAHFGVAVEMLFSLRALRTHCHDAQARRRRRMKPRRRSILSMLDDTVRWTGMPARVAAQMSDAIRRPQASAITLDPDLADRFLVRAAHDFPGLAASAGSESRWPASSRHGGILGRHLCNDAGHPHERAVRKTFVGR